jgi:hypothetical protein
MGSMLSVIDDAHSEHNQKWAVSRRGVSSNFSVPSSTAETDMETISNWKRRPSESDVSVTPQHGLAHCDTIVK